MRIRARAALALFYGAVAFLPLAWILAQAGPSGGALAALSGAAVQDLLANSILLALLTTAIALVLGLPLAFLLNLRRFPGRSLIGVLYFLPLVIPPHIHAIAWLRVLGDQGWLTAWLADAAGFDLQVRAPLGDPAASVLLGHLYPGPAWIMACATFPFVTLSTSAGIRAVDGDLLDAARQAGGRARAFRSVLLPLVAPRVVAGAFFVFVLALATFPVVSLLDTPVLIQKVFFTFSQIDQGAGAVLSLPLVAVALVAVLVLASAERRAPATAAARSPTLARGGLLTLAAALLPLLLAFGVPFASLVREAGPLRLDGTAGPDNYQVVFARVTPAFADSFVMTALGVAALLVASYPLGRMVARARGSGLEVVGLSTLALPPVVVGVALVLFWSSATAGRIGLAFLLPALAGLAALAASGGRQGRRFLGRFGAVLAFLLLAAAAAAALDLPSLVFRHGLVLVVLAMLARFLPFTVRFVRNGFLGLDPDEDAAARLAGHRGLSRLVKVELPRLRGVLAGAAVMAYVLCFTELAATLMVIPPRWQSVQARIFNMVHFRSIGEVAALCVMVTILAALPVVLAAVFGRRRWEVL